MHSYYADSPYRSKQDEQQLHAVLGYSDLGIKDEIVLRGCTNCLYNITNINVILKIYDSKTKSC